MYDKIGKLSSSENLETSYYLNIVPYRTQYYVEYNILCMLKYDVYQDNKLSSMQRCDRQDPFTSLCSHIAVIHRLIWEEMPSNTVPELVLINVILL